MGDEWNKKEQPNSIKKKRVGGIKSLLEVRNRSFISLLVNCFLIHRSVFSPLSVRTEIGGRNEKERKIKIDKRLWGSMYAGL